MTLALALTVLAPALCLLDARQVYRAGLLTVTFSTDWITSPDRVSSTEAPEICGRRDAWRRVLATRGRQKQKDPQN